MKPIRMTFRLIYIAFILARFRIDEFVLHSAWFYPVRFIVYLNPLHYFSAKQLSRGQRLRLALEKLGPIFVKFGQLLSTRRDLLPKDLADELANLQDSVKPFSGKIAKKMVEKSLEAPINEVFAEFSESALASASIAQVHGAKLLTGEDVVVKVLRPKVKKQIKKDIEILRLVAKLANHFLANADRLRPKEIVEEFESTLKAELDLACEAANASLLRRNFAGSSDLYVPEVYWDYCKRDVMVMERIYGVPIYDTEKLSTQGADLKQLAQTGLNIFFTQVFEDNFFHADMHPGNLFVSHDHRQQYIAVDFGIMGSLTDQDRHYIAANLLAFFNRDYHRIAELHVESGWVDGDTRIADFESAIRAVSEPVFEKPLKDISMGKVMVNLFRVARKFQITIQPQLILLQKTLFNIEGLGRQLCPDLDLWQTAKPYLEKWIKDQVGPKALFKKLKQSLPGIIDKAPEMPELIYDALKAIKETPSVEPEVKVVEKPSTKSLYAGFASGAIFGALIVGVIWVCV